VKKAPLTREQIHDAEISPLMERILDICKTHDIPMVASFQLDDDRTAAGPEGNMACSSAILPRGSSARLRAASQLIREGFMAFAVRRTPRGGAA
jgi:hypothetical protein